MRNKFAVGDALGSSFSVLFGNFLPFMALGLLFTLPNLFFMMSPPAMDSQSAMRALLGLGISTGCSLLLSGALVYGVISSLRGKPASVSQCISVGVSKLLPVLGCAVVTGIGIGLGLILLIIPGIILMLMWYVAIPCAVIEGTGVGESMSRSQFLTSGKRASIFGLVILLGLISFLIAMPVTVMLGSPYDISFGESGAVVVGTNMSAILANYFLGAFGAVLGACASAVTYTCLRNEKEGVDIDEIASVFS